MARPLPVMLIPTPLPLQEKNKKLVEMILGRALKESEIYKT